MVAFSDSPRLTLPIAPLGAGVVAFLAMLGCLAFPVWRLESLVMASGLPALFAAAEPPLGWTARGALALAGGATAALVAWAALHLWVGRRQLRVRVPVMVRRAKTGPSVRRADAHPDAPPRPPILAERDFGPTMADEQAPFDPDAERLLPADLTTPLAAYHPAAITPAPREPVRAPAPLARPAPLDPGERIETFALSHDVPADHAHSIESLLARLERGAQARGLARSHG